LVRKGISGEKIRKEKVIKPSLREEGGLGEKERKNLLAKKGGTSRPMPPGISGKADLLPVLL